MATPFQNPCLGNPMDRGGWQATIHGIIKSQARLSNQKTTTWRSCMMLTAFFSWPLHFGHSTTSWISASFSAFPLFLWVFVLTTTYKRASLVAQTVMNMPAIQDTQVQSLGQEHPLEKEIATHSNILAWRIPWREKHDWAMNTFQFIKYNF